MRWIQVTENLALWEWWPWHPYHPRRHTQGEAARPDIKIKKALAHSGQALHGSDFFKINAHVFFVENEAKEIVLYNFYSGFCLHFLFWLAFILLG